MLHYKSHAKQISLSTNIRYKLQAKNNIFLGREYIFYEMKIENTYIEICESKYSSSFFTLDMFSSHILTFISRRVVRNLHISFCMVKKTFFKTIFQS